MKEKQTKEKKKIGFVFIFRLISLIIILICLYSLYTWNLENNQNANLANSLISNSTNDEFNLELTKWKNKSIYNFSTNITTSDKVITLCTCDDNNSFRIVIHAKLIPLN